MYKCSQPAVWEALLVPVIRLPSALLGSPQLGQSATPSRNKAKVGFLEEIGVAISETICLI